LTNSFVNSLILEIILIIQYLFFFFLSIRNKNFDRTYNSILASLLKDVFNILITIKFNIQEIKNSRICYILYFILRIS